MTGVTLPQVFFKYFASKFQIPGLSVNGTLVENGLYNLYSRVCTFANIFINAFLFSVCLSGFVDDGGVLPIAWLEVFDLTYCSIASLCDADVSCRRKPFSLSNVFFQFKSCFKKCLLNIVGWNGTNRQGFDTNETVVAKYNY